MKRNISTATKNEFIFKLRSLLEEYNASIGFSCSDCSDTHGLSDERIRIDIDDISVVEVRGWWVQAND